MYLSYAHMPTYSVLSLFACCSVMFGGVVFFRWSLLHSHRTVVGPAFKGPSLILSLCSWFNMDRPGQSRRKPPLPPLCSLCSALYLTSLSLPSPHHNQSRTGSWITIIVLEHSWDKRKGGLLYQILVEASGHSCSLPNSVCSLFHTRSGVWHCFSTQRG